MSNKSIPKTFRTIIELVNCVRIFIPHWNCDSWGPVEKKNLKTNFNDRKKAEEFVEFYKTVYSEIQFVVTTIQNLTKN